MKLEYRVDYDRTDAELQGFLMFSAAVAGKNADTTIVAVRKLLRAIGADDGFTPFEAVRRYTRLYGCEEFKGRIRESGMGCFTSRCKSFLSMAHSELDLRACTREQLCSLHGIGFKTASMFILFTRRDAGNIAILDVHILRWLHNERNFSDVPLQTPANIGAYERVEKLFVREYHRSGFEGTLAEFDYHLWVQSRGGEGAGADHVQFPTTA